MWLQSEQTLGGRNMGRKLDRREQKTRAAIFGAFNALLQTKRYEKITVQNIIDEANIGRSTFYSHFKTKDDLLRVMCLNTFAEVFADDAASDENAADGRASSLNDKVHRLFDHLENTKENIASIVAVESGETLLAYTREHLERMFECFIPDVTTAAPSDLVMFMLVGSVTDMITWWVNDGMRHTPQEMTDFYVSSVSGLFAAK